MRLWVCQYYDHLRPLFFFLCCTTSGQDTVRAANLHSFSLRICPNSSIDIIYMLQKLRVPLALQKWPLMPLLPSPTPTHALSRPCLQCRRPCLGPCPNRPHLWARAHSGSWPLPFSPLLTPTPTARAHASLPRPHPHPCLRAQEPLSPLVQCPSGPLTSPHVPSFRVSPNPPSRHPLPTLSTLATPLTPRSGFRPAYGLPVP
jgi:hypothetical protein